MQATALVADLHGCPIPELARLGRTLHAWRVELCAHFDHPDVSNGPTENLNLKIKNTKPIARGNRNFDHYRLHLLLNHGRIGEDHSPTRTCHTTGRTCDTHVQVLNPATRDGVIPSRVRRVRLCCRRGYG
jgi:hypothetical protein